MKNDHLVKLPSRTQGLSWSEPAKIAGQFLDSSHQGLDEFAPASPEVFGDCHWNFEAEAWQDCFGTAKHAIHGTMMKDDESTWSENEGSCEITVKFGWCSCCDMGSTASVAARWQLLQDSLYFIDQPPGGVCLVLDWDTWQRSRWRQSGTCDKSDSMQSPPVFFAVFSMVFPSHASLILFVVNQCWNYLKLKMAPNVTHFCFGGINRRFFKDEQLIHVTGHISRFCRMLHGPPVLLQGHGATRRIWTPGGWAAEKSGGWHPPRDSARDVPMHIFVVRFSIINHTRFPMVCIFQAYIYIYTYTYGILWYPLW